MFVGTFWLGPNVPGTPEENEPCLCTSDISYVDIYLQPVFVIEMENLKKDTQFKDFVAINCKYMT